MARQNRQQQGTQHITLAGRVAAAVFERAGTHPFIKHARRAQKFREEHQLSIRRGMRRLVPAHVHASTQRIDNHWLDSRLQRSYLPVFDFTHTVSMPIFRHPISALLIRPFRLSQLRFLGLREPMRSIRPKRWMMRTGFQWMS